MCIVFSKKRNKQNDNIFHDIEECQWILYIVMPDYNEESNKK